MDSSASAIYHQLLDFQDDLSRHELIFNAPSPANQAYIQTLVSGLDLEFEYSTITNSARITHCSSRPPQPFPQAFEEDFLNFQELEQPSYQPDREIEDAYDPSLSDAVDWDGVFSGQDAKDLSSPHPERELGFSSVPGLPERMMSMDEHPPLKNFNREREINDAIPTAIPTAISLDDQTSYTTLPTARPPTQPFLIATRLFHLSSSHQPPISHTPRNVRDILAGLGMPEYVETFLQQGFDTWEAMIDITESDLDALGIKLGHRRKLQREIARSKNAFCDSPLWATPISPEYNSQKTEQLLANSSKARGSRDEEDDVEPMFPFPNRITADESSRTFRRSSSRPNSMSSCGSKDERNRITKAFSRRGSTQEETYPGYQVWDSRSANSSSSSIGSYASTGRRGPLGGAARAMANAVKAVKACWRCKFMRKPCDVELPCESCPKGRKGMQNSTWLAVGCKRGELKDEMCEIKLCPFYDPGRPFQPRGIDPYEHVNFRSLYGIDRRQEAITNAARSSLAFFPRPNDEIDAFLQSLEPLASRHRLKPNPDETVITTLARITLYECLAAIVWEARECTKPRSTFGSDHTMIKVFVILRAAADYQAKRESDKLIALSLICLRTCLEALRVAPECLATFAHTACTRDQCKVDCITNLETHIKMFVYELSRVFFKKDNLRSKTWWLAAFYSFYIQSIVRKGLEELIEFLERDGDRDCIGQNSAVEQYLFVALRLFVAASGTYDPLKKNYSTNDSPLISKTEDDKVSDREFKTAQDAVKQESWNSNGISSSMQYLQNLFHDTGHVLPARTTTLESLETDDDNILESQTLLDSMNNLRNFEDFGERSGKWTSPQVLQGRSPGDVYKPPFRLA